MPSEQKRTTIVRRIVMFRLFSRTVYTKALYSCEVYTAFVYARLTVRIIELIGL